MKPSKQIVGIITFHCAENYGAFLQAYALQEWLLNHVKEKYSVRVVDYRPNFLFEPYKIRIRNRLSKEAGISRKIKALVLFGIEVPNKLIRKLKFHKAWRTFQLSEKAYKNSNFLLDDNYFAVVLGSDQIWNPHTTKGLDHAYFGLVSNANCRKIAYAASIGVSTYSDSEKKELSVLLKNLDGIGVREQASVDILQPLCSQEVIINADPTILVDRHIWNQFLKPVKESNYILIYQLQRNPSIFKDAYELARESGKTILHFGDPSLKPMFPDVKVKSLSFCGPYEFLSYIRNADLVLTNSFHATCFSILLERNFFTYLQENRSERIRSIAEIGNFHDRLIEYGDRIRSKELGWSKLSSLSTIYDNLQELRKNSEQYLASQLSKEREEI